MPRARCAPLLRMPCLVLEHLVGADPAARLSLFQSCRLLRDLVLASCSQVQLSLDTQHCALGPAAPHCLQLLAKTTGAATIRLILKASVQEEDVCMAGGAEATANTTWLTQLCQHMHRSGGLWRHRVTYLELQGAFMCELVPACIINTFPNLQHLVRPGLFITQPGTQFTPTPCPQLRTLTINTAQLPVTNITTQQMQVQLKALHNLQEICMCMDGPPLPFTAEAITRCRLLQRPDSCFESDEDSDDESDGSSEMDDTIGLLASMQLTPQQTSLRTDGHAAGRYEGMAGSQHASQDGAMGYHSHVLVSGMGKLNSAGMGMGMGMSVAVGVGSTHDSSAHVGDDSIRCWDHIPADSSTDDGSYHPGLDSESMGGWDDRDFSDNCTTASTEEIDVSMGTWHQQGYDTPWLEGMRFWGSGVKVLRRQLVCLRLQDLTLLKHVCSKPQWPCLQHLDLSQAFPVHDVHVRLLVDSIPGLTDLQVSAFDIIRNHSSSKCSWQHLSVYKYISVRDLAWLPLSGLKSLRAGTLYTCSLKKADVMVHAELAAQAMTNLASCKLVHCHACTSMVWPAEPFADMHFPGVADFLPTVLPLLQKFRHRHVRLSAPQLLTELGTSLFHALPHLHTLTITPWYDANTHINATELIAKLEALCAQADRPVNLCIHKCIAEELACGWQATLSSAMQRMGHQHVTVQVV